VGAVHGRRQKPGGEGNPRHFTDVSYCQHPREHDGRRWPAYQLFHSAGNTATINALHLTRGRGGADGAYNFLFDERVFYTSDEATPAQLKALENR
jgi:hypothetical protein